jgi:hypothetical protein
MRMRKSYGQQTIEESRWAVGRQYAQTDAEDAVIRRNTPSKEAGSNFLSHEYIHAV